MINKRSVFVIGTAVLLVYILFPRIAGYVYTSSSDPIEIEEKRKEYKELAGLKNISIASKKSVQKRKNEIYLWMHVRNLQIDEGHDGLTLLEEWNELFEYLKL